jgi:hypothetical protein
MIPIFTKLVEYYLYYTPNPCLLMLASSTAIGRLATEPALRTKIFVSTLKVDLSLDDPSATVRGVMMAPLVCNDDDRQFQIFALEIFLQRPVRQRYYAESSVPSPPPVLNPDLIPPIGNPKMPAPNAYSKSAPPSSSKIPSKPSWSVAPPPPHKPNPSLPTWYTPLQTV